MKDSVQVTAVFFYISHKTEPEKIEKNVKYVVGKHLDIHHMPERM